MFPALQQTVPGLWLARGTRCEEPIPAYQLEPRSELSLMPCRSAGGKTCESSGQLSSLRLSSGGVFSRLMRSLVAVLPPTPEPLRKSKTPSFLLKSAEVSFAGTGGMFDVPSAGINPNAEI